MLISDKQTTIRIDLKPCKVDLITRHTSTPGVSYGNLSQVLLRDVPHRTLTQGVCAYLLTPGGEPAAFRPDHQFIALSEGYIQYGRTTL